MRRKNGSRQDGVFVTALLCGLAFAGCSEPGTPVAETRAELLYEGVEGGAHNATAECSYEGLLAGSGQISAGATTLQVLTGDGSALFENAFASDFVMPKQTVRGPPGQWTLRADRGAQDFDGGYEFALEC